MNTKLDVVNILCKALRIDVNVNNKGIILVSSVSSSEELDKKICRF